MKKLKEWSLAHPKAKFTLQIISWLLFVAILPIIFLIVKYDLFYTKEAAVKISGWGVIAIAIAFITIITIVNYIGKSLEYFYLKQVLDGLVKIILPLVAVILILTAVKTTIEQFIEVLTFVTISEGVGIFLNPFPKWVSDKKKERGENFIEEVLSRKKNKKGKGE